MFDNNYLTSWRNINPKSSCFCRLKHHESSKVLFWGHDLSQSNPSFTGYRRLLWWKDTIFYN